ncbi:hypothetical protein GO003_002805 [Methylicorpusculum oleiharenae]|uniref:hypothetical protein n=1 Tax=Methylicorpusculum oleiharenae TaxID=1338687 RepID=UPI00135AAED0|nr:hypothetical protein [Methylicorpusculum oleiharenae]MCD2449318.1 hypothetical protein [Methylicorpusculum oleiharenae]
MTHREFNLKHGQAYEINMKMIQADLNSSSTWRRNLANRTLATLRGCKLVYRRA